MGRVEISLPFTLPSRGLLYNGGIPDGNVIIYPIRGEHEELFAASGPANYIVLLQHIVGQLVKYPNNFNHIDLLVNDWLALLINIFSFSYGPNIQMHPTCPSCKKECSVIKQITDLDCTMADKDNIKYHEPFVAEPLPMSGDKIQYRLLRVRDMQKIEEFKAAVKNKGDKDPTETCALAHHIISINDRADISLIMRMEWVKEALGGDLRDLRNQIKENEIGYDLRQTIMCQHCSHKFGVEIPLDFFRSFNSKSRKS